MQCVSSPIPFPVAQPCPSHASVVCVDGDMSQSSLGGGVVVMSSALSGRVWWLNKMLWV